MSTSFNAIFQDVGKGSKGKWKGYKGGKASDTPLGVKGKFTSKNQSGKSKSDVAPSGSAAAPQDLQAIDHAFSSGAWAEWMPNGKESCKNFQKGTCNPGPWKTCGRSRGCPKILSHGRPCGGNHKALRCPNH